MAITLTSPPGDLTWSGSGRGGTALVEATGLEVWVVRTSTGERVCRVPHEAILDVSWSETLGPIPDSRATLVLDRNTLLDPDDPGSWLMHQVKRVETEIQIVHQHRVRHQGPVISRQRTPGDASERVEVAGSEYWLGGRLVTGDQKVFGVEQIRTQRVFDPPLDLDGVTREWRLAVWFRRSSWRITARVLVADTVPDDTPILTAGIAGGVQYPPSRAQVRADNLTRNQWTTAVLHMDLEAGGPGSVGRTFTLTVGDESIGAGELLFSEISAQVSPTSVGLDEEATPEERMYWRRESWLEVMGYLSDLGFVGWAETQGPQAQVGWKRPDVFASEAARQLTEVGGCEIEIALTPEMRIGRLWDRRGIQRDPGDITLDNDTVIKWGGWTSGVDSPVTEWIVANDDGFTGRYRDPDRFDGVLLQTYVAAPTGTPASGLAARARFAADHAAEALEEQFSAVVPWELDELVQLGDRVWCVMDDGPDAYEGWARVQSRTEQPWAAGFTITLTPWVEEGP